MNNKIQRKDYEIQLKINSENDLYNLFDKYNKTLSDDVYTYINNRLEFAHITDKIKINIESSKKIDNNNFVKAYNSYIDEQLNLVDRERKLNTTKQIWLLVVGIIFIAVSLAISNFSNSIILEIISTIGSFSIWESANSWLLERKAIKIKKLKLIRLKNSNIVFNN